VIYDATACPQDIAYPTDLGLLSKSREITEAFIDELHAANPRERSPEPIDKWPESAISRLPKTKTPLEKSFEKVSNPNFSI